MVFEQYHGRLPQTYDELTALPGIGDYTASAVLSFAFGVRIAVVDTNIRRVLSRVFLGVESRGERPVRPSGRSPAESFRRMMRRTFVMPSKPRMPARR